MAEHIIKELNENKESEIDALLNIYNNLSSITSYSNRFNINDSDLHEVYEYPSLLRCRWGLNILSQNSFRLLNSFNNQWINYRKNIEYSDIAEFIYLDPKWNDIIINHLIPALQSLENDFILNHISFQSYLLNYNPALRPSDDDLLNRASRAYHLLYTNKIIEKHYLDNN